MKFRQSRVCHNCRRHKLGCDGKRPGCTQCIHTGRQCEGYPGLLFVQSSLTPQSQSCTKPRHKARERVRRGPQYHKPAITQGASPIALSPPQFSGSTQAQSPPSLASYDDHFRPQTCDKLYPICRPLPDTLQDTISLVVRSYVPIIELPSGLRSIISQSTLVCGAWVEALPDLTRGSGSSIDECLEHAIRSLALSIAANRTSKPLLTPLSQHYGKTLRLFRRALNLPSDSHQNEKLATMMCLALSEALFPVAPNSWFIHLRAISEVMQSCKPEAFSVGIPHKLFTGIRPLLILEAMASEKATFLASDEWKTIPFQHNGPSSMQGFLSQAATIPEIMQKADLLNVETLEKDGIHRLIELSDIATQLEASAITFEIEPNAPAYWPSSQRSNVAGNGYPHLCFSDLNAANAFTHLWAFEIVCLSKITELQTAFPCLENMGDSYFGDDILIKPNMRRQRCVDLAINICQSMKYMRGMDDVRAIVCGFPSPYGLRSA
uniref:Zn(2)-C6 fungal-type domain-containing protein n=1 Tax=Bionectria ochroleuca TaxID=29856 RepID=A0A0B7KNL0_BIOOC